MDEENLRTRLAFLKPNSFMKSEKKIQAEHLMKNDIVLEGPILTCRKPFEAFASLIFFSEGTQFVWRLSSTCRSVFFTGPFVY